MNDHSGAHLPTYIICMFIYDDISYSYYRDFIFNTSPPSKKKQTKPQQTSSNSTEWRPSSLKTLSSTATDGPLVLDGLRQVATGEVFLGAEAKSKGLVDRLATSDEVRPHVGWFVGYTSYPRLREGRNLDPNTWWVDFCMWVLDKIRYIRYDQSSIESVVGLPSLQDR